MTGPFDRLEQDFARLFGNAAQQPSPEGLDSADCTDVLKANSDLELPDAERIGKERSR